MSVGSDKDIRVSWMVIAVTSVLLLVMITAMVFYLRKKANDELTIMFQLQDRMDRIEMQLQAQKAALNGAAKDRQAVHY